MSDIQPNDAAIEKLRQEITTLGQGHGVASAITDGVHSNKVRAFKAIMFASAAGVVFEGQALTLASDWAAATGMVLSENSQASAKSKVGVWIKAGKTNHGSTTLVTMDQLAGSDRDKAARYFEKLTTALRRSNKEGRPLTEDECNLILTGGSEAESDALKDFVAALKRVVTAYKAALEAMPTDLSVQKRLAQAEADHDVAEAQLKKRDAEAKISAIVKGDRQAVNLPSKTEPVSAPTVVPAAPQPVAAAAETDIGAGLFITA